MTNMATSRYSAAEFKPNTPGKFFGALVILLLLVGIPVWAARGSISGMLLAAVISIIFWGVVGYFGLKGLRDDEQKLRR